MPAALPLSCSIFVLCRRNTICTFSEPQWAFALLAAQEIITDEVEHWYRLLQAAKQWALHGIQNHPIHLNPTSMVTPSP